MSAIGIVTKKKKKKIVQTCQCKLSALDYKCKKFILLSCFLLIKKKKKVCSGVKDFETVTKSVFNNQNT